MNGIRYNFDGWQTWQWETEERFYRAQLRQDLLGDWCIFCCWGGRYNHLGSSQTLYLKSLDEADKTLKTIAKRRERRGYRLLEN